MKKILLILCALVCGTLAFAQTAGTYTDNLHVIVNGDDEGVKEGNVTIAYQDDDKSIIDFTLHNFSVDIYMSGTWMSIDLGDVTVKDVILGEEVDGVATFYCTDDHNVEYPDIDSSFALLISSITVNMTGDLSETKLHASMNITVSVLIFGDYPVTANFGYDNDFGEYLIVNVSTGNYLGGGLDWGTHATEIGKPQFFSITDQPGGYYIYGNQGGFSIGWNDDQTGLYVDGANPIAWEFIDADDGSGYYIACDDGYLTGAGFQKAVTLANTAGTTSVWKFVTKDEVLATMEDATINNPVDVTALIPAPEPKNNNWGSSWVATGYNTTNDANNVSFGWGSGTANCAESYHSSNGFDVRQTISSLPAGYYELTAQAFYRNDGGEDVIPSMYITTGTSATDNDGNFENVHLPLHSSAEGAADDMGGAYQEFLEELYPVSLTFIVDEEDEEFTVGFESNTTGDDAMWTIFGELGLLYMGTELPELTAVTGTMNATVKSTMETAIATYEANKTSANYIAAEQAIFDAEESVEQYELMAAEIAKVVPELDEAGSEAWEASDTYKAYEACTLETADEVIDGLVAAQKAQTTAGSDMTYALLNSGEWTGNTGTYDGGLERYGDEIAVDGNEPVKVLYYTVEDLQPGTYTVTFDAVANNAWVGAAVGNNIAQVFANETVADVEVYDQTGCTLADYPHTLTCTVGSDGALEFGLQNIATGGNWYIAQALTLTYLGVVEETIEWEMTSAGWGTLILPFDAEIPTVTDENEEAALTLYAGDALTLSSDGSTITVGTAATTIAANTPYLVKGTEGTYTFTGTPVDATTLTSGMLTGTLVDLTYVDFTADGTEYVLQDHGTADDGVAFYPIIADQSTDVTLNAYHCYLTLSSNTSGSGVRAFISLPGSDNEETGIMAVESDVIANDAIYDLSGRRVSKAVKGVYIQNGKKVLVK